MIWSVICQWAAESLWLSVRLVCWDPVEREHSGIALDLEAAWLSDCSNQLASVAVLYALLCSPPD